tara:strand:+ start:35 stop:1054 length:1020 start_codon:yes stop_codon:yes gene_type:complete
MDNDYRLNYYLGRANKKFYIKIPHSKKFCSGREFNATVKNLSDRTFTISPSSFSAFGICYKIDLLQIYKFLPQRYHNQPVVYVPGDVSFKLEQQSLTKSRLKTDKLGTILKVEKDRHYELKDTYLTNNTLPTIEAIKSMDCKFKSKKSSVVFRGAITPYSPKLIWLINGLRGYKPRGKARRLDLIKKYINNPRYNIAGSICHDDSNYNIPNADQYIKNHMTIKEMLTYRYVISVEGNDVASNLKWLMLSNSVVMMPTPTTVTWFMEDHLKPYVHYIPLKSNFSDLNKQFEWCEKNIDKCEQIAREATIYAMKFYDYLNEGKLNRKVLKTYIDNCEVAQR